MTNPMKEQFATDLKKAKDAGGVRVERIRKIFQAALSQAFTEVKEGSGEIRSIAKDSTSTLIDNLKEKPGNANQETVTPMEVIIEVDGAPIETVNSEMQAAVDAAGKTTVETAGETNVTETVVQVGPVAVDAVAGDRDPADTVAVDAVAVDTVAGDRDPADTVIVQPRNAAEVAPDLSPSEIFPAAAPAEQPPASATTEGLLDTFKALIERLMRSVQSGEASAKLKQQVRIADTKLTARYGERYSSLKQELQQDLQKAKTWYNGKKAESAESGTPWVEQKQAELNLKMGETGATIASKEQKIKQLLKELWQTVSQ
jgi:uncharacterized protein YecT (DUF1311 family)